MLLMLTWLWDQVDSPPCKISNLEQASWGHLATSLSGWRSASFYTGGLSHSRTMQGSRLRRGRFTVPTADLSAFAGCSASLVKNQKSITLSNTYPAKGNDHAASRWYAQTASSSPNPHFTPPHPSPA